MDLIWLPWEAEISCWARAAELTWRAHIGCTPSTRWTLRLTLQFEHGWRLPMLGQTWCAGREKEPRLKTVVLDAQVSSSSADLVWAEFPLLYVSLWFAHGVRILSIWLFVLVSWLVMMITISVNIQPVPAHCQHLFLDIIPIAAFWD